MVGGGADAPRACLCWLRPPTRRPTHAPLQAPVQEYALSRALQLDPKSVPAWVALSRLYAVHGAAALADRCLQQARSHDPMVAGIWEAMAAVAALAPG